MEKEKTFEEKLERLEEISRLMEESKLTLKDSVELYDEAQVLIRELHDELKDANERVKILTGETDGKAEIEDFGGEY